MKFRLTIIALLTILTALASYGQHKMTRDEIFKTWKGFQQKQNRDSLFRFQIHEQTRLTLDDLLKNGIDTILIYSVSYPGSIELNRDSCSTMYPVDSYFFWRQRGRSYFKMVNGNCQSGQSKTTDQLIKFMSVNYNKIADEFFMGVIYGVDAVGDDLHISGSVIDHEPKYAMLVQLGDKFKYLSFTDSDLTDKKSLFYDYNLNLTSYKLFGLIKNQLKKI